MTQDVRAVAIVGAGFMGSGIAESAARAGLDVMLQEPNPAPLERSRGRIETSVAKAVAGEKLTDTEAEALVERIEWTTDLEALAGADLVVEAVVEDAAVKGQGF